MNKHPLVMETAPSAVRQDEPTVWRWFGFIGWCAILVGTIIALVNIYKGDRLATEWMGWILVSFGLVGAIGHAAVENDQLLRRILGGVGALGLLVGVVIGIVLPLESVHLAKSWAVGLLPFLPGLIFVALFARQEAEPFFKQLAVYGLGGIGFLLTLIAFIGVITKPDWITGAGGVALVVAFFTLLLYLSLFNSTNPLGYWSAVIVGVLGAAIMVWALARSIFPELLHEWRSPPKGYAWPSAIIGLAFLVLGLLAYFLKPSSESGAGTTANQQSLKSLGRIAIVIGIVVGLIGVGRLLAPSILQTTGWFASNPRPYLGSAGILLTVAGLFYLLAGVGFASENRLVVMTRREFTAFFVSPIAYIVMFAFTIIAANNYRIFLSQLLRERSVPMEEPIVRSYIISFVLVVAVMIAVPLLTMRLLSEERRTGTLEVMLTAPLSEYLVVLSKFFATLMFFMLLFVPWVLFLVPLRLEAGQPFDYRPMLSFLLALLTSGAGFIAMGLFFSTLTKNQIIAAVLSFMGMMLMVSLYILEDSITSGEGFFASLKPVVRTVSFVDMWIDAGFGKLWLRDVVFHISAAVFWLFLSIKVLEARKWT
ncbi:MAG TPA: ABC transporter permease [Gemmataceae bacterium]|nr:ABC transporter permease [Gemmataceae bacterium]